MKKKVFLLGLVSAGVLAVGLSMVKVTEKDVSYNSNFDSHFHAGEPGSYVLSFSGTNLPATITTSFQNSFAGSIKTANGNDINLTYSNVRVNENMVQVAGHGRIYNYGASNTKISGINGVAFTGQGSLIFRPVLSDGSGKGYVVKEQAVVIAANAAKVDVPVCDYFELEAADGGAALSGLELSYSCDASEANIKLLDGMYTGVGSDSYTYKLVVNNGTASIETLDRQTKIQLSGTAVMLSKTQAKCTFVYNTYNIYYVMNFDGHSFTFVSKSDDVGGAAAAAVAEVNFDRVYNVEDYESYSASGQGYTNSTTKYQTTGLRATVYADYYTGSSSGEIGGGGWPVMTSTDNTTLLKTKGHNGTQAVAHKFSNGTSMRYISMNELYGVKSIIGKGATLSFWARGAYTNTNFDTNHSSDTPLTLYAFFDSPLTPSTQQTARESLPFTVEKGSNWQHFEMPLTEGRNYYGFGFYAKQSSGSAQYLPIDDIQIYTASPYAEYVAPVAVTGVTVSPDTLDLTVGASSTLTATVAPETATNKNVTWSSNATSVATVDATGKVTAVGVGEATITATTVDGGKTDTCVVTVSPVTLTYPEGTYYASVSLGGMSADVVISFSVESKGLVGVRVSNADMEPGTITYNSTTKEFSIPTSGSVTFAGNPYTTGTITGTFDSENNRLVNVNCDGSLSPAVSNATLEVPSTRYFEMNGTGDELKAQFKRRFRRNSGGWEVDTGNSNRFESDTTNYISGGGAMKVRPFGNAEADAYGFSLSSDFTSAAVKNIHFWVYNPGTENVVFREWVYTSANLGGAQEIGSMTAIAGQWTYVAMGFNYTIRNFNISVWRKDAKNVVINSSTAMGTTLTFDNIFIF